MIEGTKTYYLVISILRWEQSNINSQIKSLKFQDLIGLYPFNIKYFIKIGKPILTTSVRYLLILETILT